MAVDLGELIEPLQREVSPPGSDLFPDANDDLWLGHLQDAFWTARLRGAFAGYTEAEGTIVPTSGTTDLSRELQQLIVLFAGYRIIRNALRNAQTMFRAQAGPVEFETQQSAVVLRDVLKAIEAEIKVVLDSVTGDPYATTVLYFDSVIASTQSLLYGDAWFVN